MHRRPTGEAQRWSVDAGGETTTAVFEPPHLDREAGPDAVVVFAHGAGGHLADRAVLAMTGALRERGIGTVRFNFLYRERGSKRPDPMPRLLACFTAVVESVRARLSPSVLVLGGRSMGGRAASMLVSAGERCDGLLLLAYPLHPPGRPDQLRVSHLAAIGVPVLCVSGTRDPFCTPDLMRRTLASLGAHWRMHWLEGADHSFHVLKRSGRTSDEVLAEAADEVEKWVLRPISTMPGGSGC